MNPEVVQLLQQALRNNPNIMRNLMGSVGLGGMSPNMGPMAQRQEPPISLAEDRVERRVSQRPTTPAERGKIRAQEGDQPARKRAGRINQALASMLATAPMALAGFALFKGGQNPLAALARTAQGLAAADGEEPEDVAERQQETPTPEKKQPEKPSLVREALKGIDIPNLEEFQTNKIRLLAKKLESLEAQGKGPDDKNVRKIMEQISRLGKMGVVDRETERFQDAYGTQNQDEKIAAQESDRLSPTKKTAALEDTPQLENGDLVRTNKNQTGRVISVNPEKGYARVKIDKKIHNKKIGDLRQIEPSELGSSFIDTKQIYYSPDLKLGLVKFLEAPFYGYQNVDESDWKKFIKGEGTVQGEGVGPTGIRYWKNKNPSAGRGFWNYIRNNPNIPYARLSDEIHPGEFFASFSEISPNLNWKIPQPKKKKKRKKR